jgi:hypothetical protein
MCVQGTVNNGTNKSSLNHRLAGYFTGLFQSLPVVIRHEMHPALFPHFSGAECGKKVTVICTFTAIRTGLGRWAEAVCTNEYNQISKTYDERSCIVSIP